MNQHRRSFIRKAVAVAVGLAVAPLRVFAARPTEAFEKESKDDVLQSMFGKTATESGDISIKAPDIAENGAVVPITVKFKIPGASAVGIIVENNPSPLAASFELTPDSGGLVSTRVKMGKTSPVHAVIEANGKLYMASKEVKVTIGGCGG